MAQVPDAVFYGMARALLAAGGWGRRLGEFALGLADVRRDQARLRRVDTRKAAEVEDTVGRALELLQDGDRQAAREAVQAALVTLQRALPGEDGPQTWLWVRDAPDLPQRPLRVAGNLRFPCVKLQCPMTARECVLRQKVSEIQQNKDAYLGQASQFPLCRTEACAQGRGIREALNPSDEPTPRMHGPGGRFLRGKRDQAKEDAAKARLRAVGLLDEVPSIDLPPVEESEEESKDAEEHQEERAREEEEGGDEEARRAPAASSPGRRAGPRSRRATRR